MTLETKIEFERFDSIIIEEDDTQIISQFVTNYLDNPKHLIFNFDFCSSISDESLDLLNFLATLLKSKSFDFKLFSLDANVSKKLGTHRFRNLKEIGDLGEYLKGLETIEREYRAKSLLKSYIDNAMTIAFSKSNLVISRGELSLSDAPESFLNEMNYFQTFQLNDAFFSFVIGGDEQFFSNFIERLGEKELAPIFNTIMNKIPEDYKDGLNIHDYLSHPYKEFPKEKITINDQEYNYFKDCGVMRIPMSSEVGEFYLEVWIPKKFASIVYAYLNP